MRQCLTFVKADSYKNVVIEKSAIVAFDCIEGGQYRVFLRWGGHIDIRAGQYEYEKLCDAIKYGDGLYLTMDGEKEG